MNNFEFIGDRRRAFIYELFRSWHNTLVRYESALAVIEGLPYWYIERTNVGLLAAAALRIGAFPLEEYSISKGRVANRSTGRADLWILFPNGTTYDFEAKQTWVSLNSNKIANIIEPLLSEAVREAKNLSQRSDFSVGIVFVVTYVSPSSEINLSSFREQIININSYGGDFTAVHFCNEIIWRERIEDCSVYPGIAVVGRYG